jgi:CheY-like chemotaxis protein
MFSVITVISPVRAHSVDSEQGIKQRRVILVLHDVEEVRDLIQKLLTIDGYSVDPARDEETAVVIALRQPPDLLLVSLAGDGAEAVATAQRIRQRAQLTEDVAVVIFCSPTVAEGAEVELAGNVHLTRPDTFEQLRRLLSRLS